MTSGLRIRKLLASLQLSPLAITGFNCKNTPYEQQTADFRDESVIGVGARLASLHVSSVWSLPAAVASAEQRNELQPELVPLSPAGGAL